MDEEKLLCSFVFICEPFIIHAAKLDLNGSINVNISKSVKCVR